MVESTLTDTAFTDDELSELALAANPDAELPADAACFWDVADPDRRRRLPEWYMPAMQGATVVHGWRRRLILLIVVTFLAVDAAGLCNTYGWVAFG